MSTLRLVIGAAITAAALVLVPATAASAHVHGITPLRCTPGGCQLGRRPDRSDSGVCRQRRPDLRGHPDHHGWQRAAVRRRFRRRGLRRLNPADAGPQAGK